MFQQGHLEQTVRMEPKVLQGSKVSLVRSVLLARLDQRGLLGLLGPREQLEQREPQARLVPPEQPALRALQELLGRRGLLEPLE